jgi:hypothetical protein
MPPIANVSTPDPCITYPQGPSGCVNEKPKCRVCDVRSETPVYAWLDGTNLTDSKCLRHISVSSGGRR